ncbi:AAA family ATPase [Aliirhizobium smilacinae]|uniref:AAA family ATPase n=1 Tax=Aliirhizobium smilacinae TaxID=1395944 RepID=A0A5C4XGZ3_9HYPH|nr:AAA family ATPase [Rhizobium smilacinae]TNM62667.1 AAA family ATPase [Rhizobium smilacinae]
MAETTADAAFRRIAIMGNGGSGKTWLAKKLSLCLDRAPVHLDDVYWQPGPHGIARDKSIVIEEIRQLSHTSKWLMEGVYGWLIDVVLPRTTLLIFLDLPEDACIANVRSRGKQRGESDESFDELIDWVSKYRERRNNWNSFESHSLMFEQFSNEKVRLRSRTELTDYAEKLSVR